MRRLATATMAALVTACGAPSGAASAGPREAAPARSTRAPREYLVTLADGADAAALDDVYGRLGIERVRPLGRSVFLVALRDDPGLPRMEALRATDARIRAVQPNFVYRK